jgi:predicted NUDIX family NTP pyrophosphohydrolase
MKISAGLLMCNKEAGELLYFLVHPGGPYHANKNEGSWGIPKGLTEENEDAEMAARREFEEETGIVPSGPYYALDFVKMKSGKLIYAWSFIGMWNPEQGIRSNMISLEWPIRSGKFIMIPEVDRAEWMAFDKASKMIHSAQLPFLERARQYYEHAMK